MRRKTDDLMLLYSRRRTVVGASDFGGSVGLRVGCSVSRLRAWASVLESRGRVR
jgi:hypothetical protein